jgi:hypothetical protein
MRSGTRYAGSRDLVGTGLRLRHERLAPGPETGLGEINGDLLEEDLWTISLSSRLPNRHAPGRSLRVYTVGPLGGRLVQTANP